jgi:hypothetical protein
MDKENRDDRAIRSKDSHKSPAVRRLGRALIALAQAQLEAEAQAQAEGKLKKIRTDKRVDGQPKDKDEQAYTGDAA